MTTITKQEVLTALQDAVAAKAAYWDALAKLEDMTANPDVGEWADGDNDHVIDDIDLLVDREVTMEHVESLLAGMKDGRKIEC